MVAVLGGTVVHPKQLVGAEQLTYFNYEEPWLTRIKQTPYGPYKNNKKLIQRSEVQFSSSVLYETREVPGLPERAFRNCVEYAQWKRTGSIEGGKAPYKESNLHRTPKPGDIGVTYEGPGHKIYIEQVWPDYIIISDTNYKSGYMTIRKLAINSPVIKGYY